MGFQGASIKQAAELGESLLNQIRPLLAIGTEKESQRVDMLHQQDIGGNLRQLAAGKADQQDPGTPSDTAQGRLETGTPDGIVNDIDPGSAKVGGDRLDPFTDILGFVIDQVIGTMLSGGSQLFGSAGRGDHRGAQRLANLKRRQADTAGGTMNQQQFAGLQLGLPGIA